MCEADSEFAIWSRAQLKKKKKGIKWRAKDICHKWWIEGPENKSGIICQISSKI